MLCYSRSSPLIHTSFQSDSPSFGSDANILSPVIEQLVFSYSSSTQKRSLNQNRLSVLKITAISTQSSIFRRLQSYLQSETHEVMLIVINMQYSTVEIVNHLRIMIEEAETQFRSSKESNKLFVVLLHFPPEMFFNHCYPSLFLTGWDHYYLDTIAPPEEKGVIDVCQWFSHCCGAVNCKNPAEFLDEPLREIMEEAIPALAAQFSMADIVPSDQVVVENKVDMLKRIFVEGGIGKIVRERFISYWLTSVITEVSEQAALLLEIKCLRHCQMKENQTEKKCVSEETTDYSTATYLELICKKIVMLYQVFDHTLIWVIPYHFNKLLADTFQKSMKLGTHMLNV